MITEIHFVHAVTVPGTQMRQTEFRARQGWSIHEGYPDVVTLSHDQHGSFSVVRVGYSVQRDELAEAEAIAEFKGAFPHETPPAVVRIPKTDPTDNPANLTAQAATRGGKKNR